MSECTIRVAVGGNGTPAHGNFYVNDLAGTREGSQSEHLIILLLATYVCCERNNKSKWLMCLSGVDPLAESPGHSSSIGSALWRI